MIKSMPQSKGKLQILYETPVWGSGHLQLADLGEDSMGALTAIAALGFEFCLWRLSYFYELFTRKITLFIICIFSITEIDDLDAIVPAVKKLKVLSYWKQIKSFLLCKLYS